MLIKTDAGELQNKQSQNEQMLKRVFNETRYGLD